MTEERRRALREASILMRCWWLIKAPYWKIKVFLCPGCERRQQERITAQKAEHALRASLTQMVEALQEEGKKNELR